MIHFKNRICNKYARVESQMKVTRILENKKLDESARVAHL